MPLHAGKSLIHLLKEITAECRMRNIQEILDGIARFWKPGKSVYPLELVICQLSQSPKCRVF